MMCVLSKGAMSQSYDINFHTGAASYIGDLNPNNPFRVSGMGAGGQLRYNLDSYWSFSFSFLAGQFSFKDSWSTNQVNKERNLSFYTPFYESTFQVELNFLKYVSDFYGDKDFTPYLSVGAGIMHFEPKREVDGTVYKLRWYATEGQNITSVYSPWAFVLPIGFGVKKTFTRYISAFVKGELHYTFSHYLDDVSGNYPDPSTLYNDEARMLSDPSVGKVGYAGKQRGTTDTSDNFFYFGLGFTFTIRDNSCRTTIFKE